MYHKLLATLKTAPYSDNEEEDDDSEEGSVEDPVETDTEGFQDEGESGDEGTNGDVPDQESGNRLNSYCILVCFCMIQSLFMVLWLIVAIITSNCIDHSRVYLFLWGPVLGYLCYEGQVLCF